jgi:hypothetical protein
MTYSRAEMLSTRCASPSSQREVEVVPLNFIPIHIFSPSLSYSSFFLGIGAGPTLLAATFLILGEDVLTYQDGRPVYRSSATDTFAVDFGPRIGRREVARLNLIECESCFRYLQSLSTAQSSRQTEKVSIETFFGTSPPFWNTLFVLMARAIPKGVLQSRPLMDSFSKLSLPMVRLVDSFVGSQNGKRGKAM